jgi:hypothetical protein
MTNFSAFAADEMNAKPSNNVERNARLIIGGRVENCFKHLRRMKLATRDSMKSKAFSKKTRFANPSGCFQVFWMFGLVSP